MLNAYLAILFFVLLCFFLGISLNFFFRFTSFFTEWTYKIASLLVSGFSFLVLLIFILGIFRIPLFFPAFILISLVIPIYWVYKDNTFISQFNLATFSKFKISEIIFVVITIFFFSYMFHGAFSYPWLEDDDPWSYATGAKYVSIYKDYHTADGSYYLFPFNPPTTSVLLGLLNQITPDLYTAMKTFICMVLALGLMAFFLFSYVLSDSSRFSLIAMLILSITPCYIGHFIFNYTVAISLLQVLLFGIALALKSKKAIILAAIFCSSVLITHPVAAVQAAIIMFIFLVVFLVREFHGKTFKKSSILHYLENNSIKIISIGILGIVLSMFLYGDLILYFIGIGNSNQVSDDLEKRGIGNGGIISLSYNLVGYDIEDKAFSDFFIAKPVSRMDQEEGIGIFLFSICLIGILFFFFLKDKLYHNNIIYLLCFLFFFFFLWIFTGGYFKFSIQNYRWWSILAIFVALHASSTIMILFSILKKDKLILYSILALLAIGLIYTSAVPRYKVQTSSWPPGVDWLSQEQINGFVNLRNIGNSNLIFSLCSGERKIIANNQMALPWHPDIKKYNSLITNSSYEKNSSFAIEYAEKLIPELGFSYLIIDASCLNYYGLNETNKILQHFINDSSRYMLDQSLSNNAFFMFKVLNII